MRLTKKKAIAITIELWTWLAETGKQKWVWPGWDKYKYMSAGCPLCEYVRRRVGKDRATCRGCPYYSMFGYCTGAGSAYHEWEGARSVGARKNYALLFLEQLKQLQ